MPLVFGGVGVTPSLRGQPSNRYSLQAGEVELIPAGDWAVATDRACDYQVYDTVVGIWRSPGGGPSFGNSTMFIHSDGANHRVANQTGCIVGALVNTAGAGYTSAPVVTNSTSTGAATAIVGGAVNTSVTVVNGGASYVYPPLVAFSAPPFPGVPATGYSTISGGVVTTVTVVDQGAGYASAPVITFYNDPRDSTGYGAAAAAVLTGSGTVTAVLVTDHGTAFTTGQTALPTFTLTGGGYSTQATAIAIMDWGLTSFTITNSGTSGLSATGLTTAVGLGSGFTATASVLLNPSVQSGLVKTRQGLIIPTVAAGAITAVGTVLDPGIYSGINVSIQALTGAGTTVGSAVSLTAPSFAGYNGFYSLLPV